MQSKEEVQEELGLDELPDDEFMALLREAGEEEIVSGGSPVEGDGYTPEDIRDELSEAIVAKNVGEMISNIREQAGISLRDAAETIGVSHSRIQQLEASDNVEVATLARVAAGLGFQVKLSLKPEETNSENYRPVETDLTEAVDAG